MKTRPNHVIALVALAAGAALAGPDDPHAQAIQAARDAGILGPPAPQPASIAPGIYQCEGTRDAALVAHALAVRGMFEVSIDLGRSWLHAVYTPIKGRGDAYEAFTSLDHTTKKWRRVEIWPSATRTATSADDQLDFDVTDPFRPTHDQERFHIDASDPKLVKFRSEWLRAGARTWFRDREVSCKR